MGAKRKWILTLFVVLAMVATACGGDDSSDEGDSSESGDDVGTDSSDEGPEVDGPAQPASSAPVEAVRVGFETIHDGPFDLLSADGDLWLIESDFSALRIDTSLATSSCDTSLCLTSASVSFGDTFVPVGARLFAVDEEFSPNHFVWIGSELADAPHNVIDDRLDPGDASGDFSPQIARVGDFVYAFDATSDAIESIDATVDDIDTAPVVGSPIPAILNVTDETVNPFPENTRLISDGETLWIYSTSNSTQYPSGGFGPPPAAAVDLDAGEISPIIDLTTNEFGMIHKIAAAGGSLIVSGINGEEDGSVESFVTAFAPDGAATHFDLPERALRNLTASGDRVLALMEEEADYQAFILDPADGSAEPIDLDVNPDATVTAFYGHDSGVWAVANGRDIPTELLRIDLAAGEVVERIELTDELVDGIGPSYVDGRPYFVLGDGLSEHWELVILGGEGIDLGYPTSQAGSDPDAGSDSNTDDHSPGAPDGDESDGDEPDGDEPDGDETDDPQTPTTTTTTAPSGDDECEPGQSLAECYG